MPVAPPDHEVVPVSDRPELAEKIQSQFDSVFNNEVDDTPEPAVETDAEAPEETPVAEAEPVVEETPEATEAAPDATVTPVAGPTLPEAYRRSLKAYEWTDAEIDANLKALGPSFIQTAAKLHQTRHKETNAWAEMGRKARTDAQAAATPDAPRAAQPTQPQQLQRVDAAALKRQYGEEALIDALVGPLNATVDQINRVLPVIQQTQNHAQMQAMEGLHRQIDGFFGSKQMTAYHGQYGTKTADLNDTQLGARQKVLELADAIVSGARQQGRYLSLDEAMQMAHDSGSSENKTTVARKEITQQMQQRNKGITLRPSARTAGSPNTPSANRNAMEKNISKALSGLFK